ncbi:MAG: hypothetical protein HY688_02100, partial [Chloroflexi bacterium]|nr:hypothetical protein [Chloroflexota bacterium]
MATDTDIGDQRVRAASRARPGGIMTEYSGCLRGTFIVVRIGSQMNQDLEEARPNESAAPERVEMAQLLAAETERMSSFRRGDAVDGTVVRVDKDGVLV